ncbi:WecB/TagA/CpsF family glycosyltransferase [Candidatus Gottesmanbacteria bacterium]|nr:WecB/TagA/CpsF family glycosyltransferase [Candidatus Gottesmanbacteria bacterium]
MGKNKIFILGIGVSNLNFSQVLEEIEKWFENGSKIYQIFTPNPEIIILAQKDKKFAQILNNADLALPDGQGIIWASRFLGQPLKERITGVDLAEKLSELAAKKGLTIGLIGGGPQIAVKALECLKEKYPGLNGWAEEGPRIEMANGKWQMANGYDLDLLIEKIKKTETRIVFVGMGAPKQEYFIENVKCQMSNVKCPLVLMAVGGAFDYLSGRVLRAPKWMQNLGFEWLYRLIRQSWRWRRQLALLKFIVLVLKSKSAFRRVKDGERVEDAGFL